MAAIAAKLETEIVVAMKAKEADKLTTLRMVKAALKNKEIDKREPLTEVEEQAVLTTMIKQRKDSATQFREGNRRELAEKEEGEIALIETYMPQAASDEEILTIIRGAVEHLKHDNGGIQPGPKDMGPAMRVVKQRLLASGIRADGSTVSEMLKAELAK